MSNIEVLTSITGNKDTLRNDQVRGSAIWTAFLDIPQESNLWNIKLAYTAMLI
jgi:hypothetical protein